MFSTKPKPKRTADLFMAVSTIVLPDGEYPLDSSKPEQLLDLLKKCIAFDKCNAFDSYGEVQLILDHLPLEAVYIQRIAELCKTSAQPSGAAYYALTMHILTFIKRNKPSVELPPEPISLLRDYLTKVSPGSEPHEFTIFVLENIQAIQSARQNFEDILASLASTATFDVLAYYMGEANKKMRFLEGKSQVESLPDAEVAEFRESVFMTRLFVDAAAACDGLDEEMKKKLDCIQTGLSETQLDMFDYLNRHYIERSITPEERPLYDEVRSAIKAIVDEINFRGPSEYSVRQAIMVRLHENLITLLEKAVAKKQLVYMVNTTIEGTVERLEGMIQALLNFLDKDTKLSKAKKNKESTKLKEVGLALINRLIALESPALINRQEVDAERARAIIKIDPTLQVALREKMAVYMAEADAAAKTTYLREILLEAGRVQAEIKKRPDYQQAINQLFPQYCYVVATYWSNPDAKALERAAKIILKFDLLAIFDQLCVAIPLQADAEEWEQFFVLAQIQMALLIKNKTPESYASLMILLREIAKLKALHPEYVRLCQDLLSYEAELNADPAFALYQEDYQLHLKAMQEQVQNSDFTFPLAVTEHTFSLHQPFESKTVEAQFAELQVASRLVPRETYPAYLGNVIAWLLAHPDYAQGWQLLSELLSEYTTQKGMLVPVFANREHYFKLLQQCHGLLLSTDDAAQVAVLQSVLLQTLAFFPPMRETEATLDIEELTILNASMNYLAKLDFPGDASLKQLALFHGQIASLYSTLAHHGAPALLTLYDASKEQLAEFSKSLHSPERKTVHYFSFDNIIHLLLDFAHLPTYLQSIGREPDTVQYARTIQITLIEFHHNLAQIRSHKPAIFPRAEWNARFDSWCDQLIAAKARLQAIIEGKAKPALGNVASKSPEPVAEPAAEATTTVSSGIVECVEASLATPSETIRDQALAQLERARQIAGVQYEDVALPEFEKALNTMRDEPGCSDIAFAVYQNIANIAWRYMMDFNSWTILRQWSRGVGYYFATSMQTGLLASILSEEFMSTAQEIVIEWQNHQSNVLAFLNEYVENHGAVADKQALAAYILGYARCQTNPAAKYQTYQALFSTYKTQPGYFVYLHRAYIEMLEVAQNYCRAVITHNNPALIQPALTWSQHALIALADLQTYATHFCAGDPMTGSMLHLAVGMQQQHDMAISGFKMLACADKSIEAGLPDCAGGQARVASVMQQLRAGGAPAASVEAVARSL
jgi:hypothetical protein